MYTVLVIQPFGFQIFFLSVIMSHAHFCSAVPLSHEAVMFQSYFLRIFKSLLLAKTVATVT